jgi:hypothetical protein
MARPKKEEYQYKLLSIKELLALNFQTLSVGEIVNLSRDVGSIQASIREAIKDLQSLIVSVDRSQKNDREEDYDPFIYNKESTSKNPYTASFAPQAALPQEEGTSLLGEEFDPLSGSPNFDPPQEETVEDFLGVNEEELKAQISQTLKNLSDVQDIIF